jgi:hypothetical protein
MRVILPTLLFLSLLAGACSAPFTSPRPSTTAPSTNFPCTTADVTALLSSFVRAIDAGDEQAITAALATAVIFSDDRRQVGGDLAAPHARDAIVRHFLDRHAAGERFELTRGQANSARDFEYDLKVTVAQVGTHFAVGKGVTDDPFNCADQRIAVWNMARHP